MLLGYPDSGGVDYNTPQWTTFPNVAFYAQDQWHVTSRLTIDVGLRYDIQLVPQPPRPNTNTPLTTLYSSKINIDSNNFAPRIGAASIHWSSFPSPVGP